MVFCDCGRYFNPGMGIACLGFPFARKVLIAAQMEKPRLGSLV